jgi:class 3 adenylate cyclase
MTSFSSELQKQVEQFFRDSWARRDGQVVPETTGVKLYNDAVDLDAVVLYADLAESTQLVERKKDTFAAEVYKSFLYCAARIIELRNGVVTAYDGDRVMGVFIGKNKRTSAARAALNINYAATKIIMPALKSRYTKSDYVLRHCVGVDASKLLVARTGVRGANDLVWVGRAANYAAKLSALRVGCPTIISASVHELLHKTSKYAADGRNMWTLLDEEHMPGTTLYGSTFWWQP